MPNIKFQPANQPNLFRALHSYLDLMTLMAIDKSDRGWNLVFFFFTSTFLHRFVRAEDFDRISASKHAIEFEKAIIGFAFAHKAAGHRMVLLGCYRSHFSSIYSFIWPLSFGWFILRDFLYFLPRSNGLA